MNFTFVVKKPEDGGFGAMNKNGTWTGMIGGVQRRDYDMGKSGHILTKYISFLKDFFYFSHRSLSNYSGEEQSHFIFSGNWQCIP